MYIKTRSPEDPVSTPNAPTGRKKEHLIADVVLPPRTAFHVALNVVCVCLGSLVACSCSVLASFLSLLCQLITEGRSGRESTLEVDIRCWRPCL